MLNYAPIVKGVSKKQIVKNKTIRVLLDSGSSGLAGNVGVVSGIFSPQNDVGADMSAPCRRHDTDHVGDMAPCRLAGRCVGVVSA